MIAPWWRPWWRPCGDDVAWWRHAWWQVLWWDVRKLIEPIEGLWLEDKTNDGARMGGTSMEYTGAGGKFLIGSEQGRIMSCSRKGKTPADKIGAIFDAHVGPIYALQRNPW